MKRVVFIAGTDTGVGKTFFTAGLTRWLRARGVDVRAVKPLCSGSRDDAEALAAAQDGHVTLDAINPWFFSAPITPLLAARKERKRVALAEVVAFLRDARSRCACLLIEGAGGLLSPLGEGFGSLELIRALRADTVIVAPNRLGVLNHALLTLRALPPSTARRAPVVLMHQSRPDSAARDNAGLLGELVGTKRVFEMPFVTHQEPRPTRKEDAILRSLAAELQLI